MLPRKTFSQACLYARELRKRNLTFLGTIRSHGREIPLALRSHHNRELSSSKFLFTTVDQTPIQLVSYNAKTNKVVLMISPAQNSGSGDQSDFLKKLEAFFQYNKTKGCVDVLDRMIGNYSIKYKSRRWHVVVFCNVLDIAGYNSFVLFSKVFPEYQSNNCHKRRLFLIDLGTKLSTSYRGTRQRLPSTIDNVHHQNQVVKKKKRCRFFQKTE